MKKTFALLGSALLLCAFLMTSCGGPRAQVTVYDGEIQWPTMYYNVMVGLSEDGTPALWCPIIQSQVGNSSRTMSFSVMTCEPGTYSGVYDAANEKWSNPAIANVRLNVDYDGVPYPTWYGQSATVTIHRYNKRAKLLDATLEAVVMKEGTTETRSIRVDVRYLNVSGK